MPGEITGLVVGLFIGAVGVLALISTHPYHHSMEYARLGDCDPNGGVESMALDREFFSEHKHIITCVNGATFTYTREDIKDEVE